MALGQWLLGAAADAGGFSQIEIVLRGWNEDIESVLLTSLDIGLAYDDDFRPGSSGWL